MSKIVDLGDSIYREISDDTSISIASIAAWLRFNVNKLNILINKDYTTNSSLELVDSSGTLLGEDEGAILKQLYLIYYFSRLIRKFSGVGAVDQVIEVDSDGARVRMTNKNEIAKMYLSEKKEHMEELKKLINFYRFKNYIPSQIVGDEIDATTANSIFELTDDRNG